MSVQTLDVFSLRESVVDEYQHFARSFTTIRSDDIRQQIEEIYSDERYWPEPLIQINANYKRSSSVDALVSRGLLEPGCREIFSEGRGRPLELYQHQERAIELATQGESFVVTSGTGSGKSLCFLIPIVNHVLATSGGPGTRRTCAVIIYPMNALANSQLEEIRKFARNVAGEPVTFERYTGQEKPEERKRIADNPPDILLTNFMMLELLMTRQDAVDRRVIDHCKGLRFLVLDELHTYRGRQGADVALLVRRVRERLAPKNLVCIGTSATMASEGSARDKKAVVAEVASKLFGSTLSEGNVIAETLEHVTRPLTNGSSIPELGTAIDQGVPRNASNQVLETYPLAIWIENRLGMELSPLDQQWVRAKPKTVHEAVEALATDAGREAGACRTALRDLLLISSTPERNRTGNPEDEGTSFFAFKLHQFISGAGHAFATLEAPGERSVTVDGQQFLPGHPDKRLYSVHFCRECGHEYHPVRWLTMDGQSRFLARDIDDAPPKEDDATEGSLADGELFGFLTPHPPNDPDFVFRDEDGDYPESWLQFDAAGNPRLKPYYRNARARHVRVAPDGSVGSGVRAWFLPGKFRVCLRCGSTRGGAARDRTRLASLSAEGRSSATTVLVASVLKWMHGAGSALAPYAKKLLGFSDNRQDAALQAGHFNDFLFVSLLRAGFLGALERAGSTGLRSDELGAATQQSLGFDRPAPEIRTEWLLEPSLRGFNLQEAESTLRQVLTYRVWFDQRRGWRYTFPNLEQLSLVEVEYLGLDELARDEELFKASEPVLRDADPGVRMNVYRTLLDHLRKWLAIRSQVLEAGVLEQLQAKSHSRIRLPWGFGVDEKPESARWLLVAAPPQRKLNPRDSHLIARGGSRSALGRALRSTVLWGGDTTIRDLKSKQVDELVEQLLSAAALHGLVSQERTPFDLPGWRLNDACVLFRLGRPSREAPSSKDNVFFKDLYENLARMLQQEMHPLFGFEAREHTAQVDPESRSVREKRFRYGEVERAELDAELKDLREIGETSRFLPVLFCSPTMELGVDISALNAVHLRNVPPTPANYAQRSGRAGRSGQAALVVTYASSQSPHDQYFFRDPKAMVHGEVRAPLLDLANRDLVDSHLQAVWLSCVDQEIEGSISELLVLNDPERPLRPEVVESINEARVRREAIERVQRVLGSIEADLTRARAPWYTGREQYADDVIHLADRRFDKAFKRWRLLFTAAENQRDAARRTMDDYSAPYQDKKTAQSRHSQAVNQLNLLQMGHGHRNSLSSDFYTYRYLATEGFLPGYNFPRLPLMAYIPRTGRGRQTYLQRPRFLALSEFGPWSLVYHEGSAYRVVRALLSLAWRAEATPETRLPTRTVRICAQCGAGHFDDQASLCVACGTDLGAADVVGNAFRIENVETRPAERITANDEERQRQGFELQTTFKWAVREDELDVRKATVNEGDNRVASLAYGAGAEITRLNKGLRRRANKKVVGFPIDPVSGYWGQDDSKAAGKTADPTVVASQRIVPYVQDRKNALLFEPVIRASTATTIATVQHALLRGIETRFQLEEGEILAEPMPTRELRNGFLLYEATEGGAGVLSRLVAEDNGLAMVAREALRVMHFAVREDEPLPPTSADLVDADKGSCVAACYRCLMSYYNQPDHDLIDRRDDPARELLLSLARSITVEQSAKPGNCLEMSHDGGEASWLAEAARRGIPAPDQKPLEAAGQELRLVWRQHYVAVLVESAGSEVLTRLDDLGFEVIRFADAPGRDASFGRLAAALGSTV